MKIIEAGNRRALNRVLARGRTSDRALERRVAAIVEAVRRGGDAALVRFAQKFDSLAPPIEVSFAEMRNGAAMVPLEVRRAIERAARNIARVAFRQIPKHWDIRVSPGVVVEQRVEPLGRVGCYVPGGRFPLPSSLLMTAIPARVAGVPEVIAMCPRPEPVVMAAALEAGVSRLFRVGGAHGIAAMAYGTATIPQVDKIVGTGQPVRRRRQGARLRRLRDRFLRRSHRNRDRRRSGAGRTRVPAEWIAADLVAQAEHDPDARSIFDHLERAARGAGGEARRGESRRAADRQAVARRTRRHPDRGHRRRSDGAGQLDRARAPGRRFASACCAGRSGRARCSSARSAPRPPAITRPVRITSCRRRARRGSAAACRPPTSSA